MPPSISGTTTRGRLQPQEKIQQINPYNHAPCGRKPRGAFFMYAPQEACGVVFDVKAIVLCRGFCVLPST